MSTNVEDRHKFSLVINTPRVSDHKEAFEELVNYFENVHQKKEVPTVYCEKCLDTGWQKVIINKVSRVIRCNEHYHLIDKLINVGIEDSNKHYTFFNYRPENNQQKQAKKMAENFVESFVNLGHQNTKGLIFYGEGDTGKTHLTISIVKELLSAGKLSIKYTNSFTGILNLIAGLELLDITILEPCRDWHEWQKTLPMTLDKKKDKFWYEHELTRELLVLEHFIKPVADIEKDIFSHIVAYRYNNYLPLILTTRLDLDEIEQSLAPSTFSKLIDICEFVPLS
jgi:DNA replication protein DnaC